MKFALIHLGKNLGGLVIDQFTPVNDGFFLNEQPVFVTQEGLILLNLRDRLPDDESAYEIAAQDLDKELRQKFGKGIESIILLKAFREEDTNAFGAAMQRGIASSPIILSLGHDKDKEGMIGEKFTLDGTTKV